MKCMFVAMRWVFVAVALILGSTACNGSQGNTDTDEELPDDTDSGEGTDSDTAGDTVAPDTAGDTDSVTEDTSEDSDTAADTTEDTTEDTDSLTTDTMEEPDTAYFEDVEDDQIGDKVFDDSVLRSYYFTISDEEYEKLMDMTTLVQNWTVNKERYVEVGLKVDDVVLPSVAMRFKGDWSLKSCVIGGVRQSRVEPVFGNIDVCQRFSLKVDFDRYNDKYRVDGLKKLNFHAMSADPTKMHERLGYSLYREMGIHAPRAVHAKVYINGEYHGLFVAVEQVDSRFVAKRFSENSDGNLYKQVWPGSTVDQYTVEEALSTNNDPDEMDVSDFMEFSDAIASTATGDFVATTEAYLDLDYLARYMVVDRAIANSDGVMAFYGDFGAANHNYYWYHDLQSGRFVLIPWDLDKIFITPEPNFWFNNTGTLGSDYVAVCTPENVPNWNVVSADCDIHSCSFDALGFQYGLMPPDCDILLKNLRTEVYASQSEIAQSFVDEQFSVASVDEKLDRWAAQISDALEEDEKVDRAAVMDAIVQLKADLVLLRENLSLMMSGLIEE